MKDNLKRVGIGSDDDEFAYGTVKGFGGFISPLFDLLTRGTLCDQVINAGGKFFSGEGLSAF